MGAYVGRRNKPSSVPPKRGGPFLWGRRHRRPLAAYPGLERSGRLLVPVWPCSGWGLPCHSRYRERGALLPHRFTLACARDRGPEPSAVCSLLHFPSPRDARGLPGTLPCGARTFLDAARGAAVLTRLPAFSNNQCPGEDSNLHAVSGTRSLVWPVYQFQHLGNRLPGPPTDHDAPERTRTSTGLRPLDPESSASTSSATGAFLHRLQVRPERFELPAF
jgi:hypothetical protein